MKRCPRCNRVETDDALAFWRMDGTGLIGGFGAISGEPATVKPGSGAVTSEVETSILAHSTDAAIRDELS